MPGESSALCLACGSLQVNAGAHRCRCASTFQAFPRGAAGMLGMASAVDAVRAMEEELELRAERAALNEVLLGEALRGD